MISLYFFYFLLFFVIYINNMQAYLFNCDEKVGILLETKGDLNFIFVTFTL